MNDDLLAFTAQQVARLSGLSERQLRAWDKTGFFEPRYAADDRRRPYSRLYSFQDLVGLRTIAVLIRDYHIPLQQLRKVGRWLKEHHDAPWTSLRFFVRGREVFFDEPSTRARVATRPAGQTAFPIEMDEIVTSVRQAAERLRARDPDKIGQIAQQRNVVQNASVLAGTRIPTEAIWNFHQAGYDPEAILHEYPDITADDVRAALEYESRRRERVS